MKVTFIGHAAVLIETAGLRILSDPWWEGPCFGTQWWVYPRAETTAIGDQPLDYVYISHGHHDHLHLGTLRRLKVGKVLVSSTLDVAPFLRERGFEVWEIGPEEEVDLGQGVKARLMPTCNDDTILAVADGAASCLNLNDAVHAAPGDVQDRVLGKLRALYPNPTYLFCGYGIASHFPACYVIPGTDRVATAARRQAYFNRQWVKIVQALQPRFAFPFAADVGFLDEDLIWANEPIHNAERPTDVFNAHYPAAATTALDIAPGFAINGERIIADKRFKPVNLDHLRRDYADEYAVANRTSKIPAGGIEALADLVRQNVKLCRDYLAEFAGDYTALIVLRDADTGIRLSKRGGDFAVGVTSAKPAATDDLLFTTRFSYLRRALSEQYGGEVLYVGSGCILEYRNPAMVAKNLHRELLALLRYRTIPPASRFGDQPKWLYKLKMAAKKLLGRAEPDLYDLNTWFVRS